MKIVILSDGKYGDRAANVIKTKFPSTILKVLEERDPTMFLDEVILEEDVETAIKNADLLILYVRHPDVVAEICERQKPTIISVHLGQGFLRQVLYSNPKVIMPKSMCNATPDTGIEEIDGYLRHFGTPIYDLEVGYIEDHIPIAKNMKLLIESPCGASNASLEFINEKKITPETLNLFALNIRQECREPVSILLSHEDISESSASLHLLKLLDAIQKADPSLFKPETELGKYVEQRRKEYRTKNLNMLF
jgi:hypothetical protein